MELRSETWESFWAHKLRIEFFEGQWEMYRKAADARAEWLEETFQLDQSKPVLSLACGEGGIELAMARRGFKVTALDKCTTFIHFAREKAAQEELDITFLTGNLQEDKQLPSGNGLVCCFDTFGLLGSEAEEKLVARMAEALDPEGTLLVDCPQREAQSASRTWWKMSDGFLLQETRYDRSAQVLLIDPLFIEPEGKLVNLKDPYDPTAKEHPGVLRYLYAPAELQRLVHNTDLQSGLMNHQRKGYYMVIGRQAGLVDDMRYA